MWNRRHDATGKSNTEARFNTVVLIRSQEQVRYQDRERRSQWRHKLDSRTNVHAVGRTILNLMTLTTDTAAVPLQPKYDAPNCGDVHVPSALWDYYDHDLINLVERCLEAEPRRRIEVNKLLDAITEHVQGYDKKQPHDSVPKKFQRLPEGAKLWVKKDEYEMLAK